MIGTCLTFNAQLYAADARSVVEWYKSNVMSLPNPLSKQLQYQFAIAKELGHEKAPELKDAVLFFENEEEYGLRNPTNETRYKRCVQQQREKFLEQQDILGNSSNPDAGLLESLIAKARNLSAPVKINSNLAKSAEDSINGIRTMFPNIPKTSLLETVFPPISSPVSLLKNPKTGAAVGMLTWIYQLARGKSRLTNTIKTLSFAQASNMLFYNWNHAQQQIKRYQIMSQIASKYIVPSRR